jgi:DMSO/TMAO reductase YedYZ molybdopterin-dependent catalytic subunit
MNRRTFLKNTGGIVVGASVLGLSGCEFNSVEPLTAGAAVPFLTPLGQLYFKNGAETSIPNWSVPVLNTTTWKLAIEGLVSRPMQVTFADLESHADAMISVLKTMRCVIDSNEVQGLIGTVLWTGVPLRIVLESAGVDWQSTKRLRLYGADGFTNNVPIESVLNPQPGLAEPLLVTELNRQPLTAEHGAPVRLMIHDSFGYKNVKWITRVEATSDDSVFGTYQDAGFVDDGILRTVSRGTNPLENSQHQPGEVVIRGFAVSGTAGIAQVDVSVNGAPFEPALLESKDEVVASSTLVNDSIQAQNPEAYPFPWKGVWRRWEYSFNATPGNYVVRIRATDTTGKAQPETDDDISDGINSIPSVRFTVA